LRTGNLPQVTRVMTHAAETEHPKFMPAAGENDVRTILEELWANSKIWARTAFIST
jgi:phospholipase C